MTNAREASTHLAALLRNERGFLADFLLALADFDAKTMWRELGYPSLFLYLHKGLKLSKSASQTRKTAAGLIQSFPEVGRAIRSGELCLSTVNDVAHVLTKENVGEVLPRFFGLSHREAEIIAAELRPPEVVPTRELGRCGRLPLRPPRRSRAACSPGRWNESSPLEPQTSAPLMRFRRRTQTHRRI